MSDPSPLLDGDPESIGGYRLIGRLGAGGQGIVYLARTRDDALVAVKSLSTGALHGQSDRQRFVREAEAARRVASFCTAAVLDADFASTPPYIVSEYVDGPSLRRRIRQRGPMGGGDLSRLAVATVTALAAIHEAEIVHRDFNPANVLLGEGGARVIDFGIAQITGGAGTQTNSTVGTPAFMAPEQISHGHVAPASDVFSWGAVMVYAATGASPFDRPTVPAIFNSVLSGEPDLGGVPEPLRALVSAALAKDPEARPTSLDLLLSLLGRSGQPDAPDTLTQVLHDAQATVRGAGPAAPPASSDTEEPPDTMAPPETVAYPGTRRTGTEGRGGRRGPVRAQWWLIGVGVLALAVALVGSGMLLGRVLEPGGGGPEAGGDAAGPEKGSGAPGFSEREAGTWEGVAANGNLIEVETEAGERTGSLRSLTGLCSAEIGLVEDSGPGYAAEVSFGGMMESLCVDTHYWPLRDQVSLTVDGDTMDIGFFEEGAEDGPRVTLTLRRVA